MVCQSRGQDQGFFTGEEDTDDAEKIILKTEDGQNVKGYPCTPCIVGTWKDAYETEKLSGIIRTEQTRETGCVR